MRRPPAAAAAQRTAARRKVSRGSSRRAGPLAPPPEGSHDWPRGRASLGLMMSDDVAWAFAIPDRAALHHLCGHDRNGRWPVAGRGGETSRGRIRKSQDQVIIPTAENVHCLLLSSSAVASSRDDTTTIAGQCVPTRLACLHGPASSQASQQKLTAHDAPLLAEAGRR